jgi:hypothetical protein
MGCLSAALLGLAGCFTTESNNLKPPPHPEEFILPPSDDPRFSTFIAYPKETLNADTIKRDQETAPGAPSLRGPTSPARFGAGAGGGGY